MPRFEAAHLREQGQDMIIFPLDRSFDRKTDEDRYEVLEELQMRASAAGLAGTAVAVWRSGGRMKFMAPTQWHPFFRSIDMRTVMRNVNVEVSW